MKKVLAFAAFALVLAACNSTAKYKPMIEELSGKWDSATSTVAGFAESLKAEQSGWMTATNGMQVAPEAMAKWNDATKAQYNTAKAAVDANTNSMSGMAADVDGFLTAWTTKSAEVQAMKDGLAAGKLEGDVNAKIADLTAAATDAAAKVEGWKAKLAEVKATAGASMKSMSDFIAANAAPAADPKAGKK